jgi:quercetin dioxygenase-like cupin family protein
MTPPRVASDGHPPKEEHVQHWDIRSIDVQPHQPEVLHTAPEGRTIAIALPAGELLQDHQVHERAWLAVIDGEVEVDADDATVTAGSGALFVFEPKQPHEVRATSDARLLLLLAPWPGEGRDVDFDA